MSVCKNVDKDRYTVAKAGFWFTFCNLLQRGIQFLVTPIYTRLLLPESYGRYSTFLTWCNLLGVIATLSLSSGVFNKAMVKFEDDRDCYLTSMIGLSFLSTIATAIIYFFVYPFFQKKIGLSVVQSILMFLCIYFQMAIQLWSARKRYEYRYKELVAATVIFALLIPFIGIGLFYTMFHSEMGLIIGYAIANVIVGMVLLINSIKGVSFLFDSTFWKYALLFNIPLIPHYLSNVVLGQSDRLMISYYCGDYQTGLYTLAYQISLVMNIVTNGIENAFIPWIYGKIKSNSYQEIGKRINSLILVASIPFVLIMLVAPEFISILGSTAYREAIYVIPPIVVSSYFMFINTYLVSVLFYFEKNISVMFSTTLGALVNVILNIIFLPYLGYIAAAYTTLIGYMVIYGSNFLAVRLKAWEIGQRIYNVKTILVSIGIIIVSCFVSIELYQVHFFNRWIVVAIILIGLIIKRGALMNYIDSA